MSKLQTLGRGRGIFHPPARSPEHLSSQGWARSFFQSPTQMQGPKAGASPGAKAGSWMGTAAFRAWTSVFGMWTCNLQAFHPFNQDISRKTRGGGSLPHAWLGHTRRPQDRELQGSTEEEGRCPALDMVGGHAEFHGKVSGGLPHTERKPLEKPSCPCRNILGRGPTCEMG